MAKLYLESTESMGGDYTEANILTVTHPSHAMEGSDGSIARY